MNRRAMVLLLAIGLMSIIAACGNQGHGSAGAPLPTALHVVRFSALPIAHYPPLDRTATDVAAVQHLYRLVQSLPPSRAGTYGCGNDNGLRYQLSFTTRSRLVLEAIATPQGCAGLTIDGNDGRQVSDMFWSELARTIGVPTSDLFVRPLDYP